MAADTGFGIAITFSTGFFAEITNVVGPNLSRDDVNTSHAGTTGGYMTYIPKDLVEGGELTVDINFDPDEEPPIGGAAESVTVTYPNGATWQFSGYLKGFTPTAPYDDKMTATATIKVAGAVTFTPAA